MVSADMTMHGSNMKSWGRSSSIIFGGKLPYAPSWLYLDSLASCHNSAHSDTKLIGARSLPSR